MSIETALRRHADQEWPEPPWMWHDHTQPIEHEPTDDPSWKVCQFPVRRLSQPYVVRAAKPDTSVELRRLADEWKAATLFMSSTQQMFLHPAYQQIIGFGEKALPFLFDELRSSDDYWFWALSMITREDPIPSALNGNYRAMKEAWLNWADVHNL